MDATTRRRPGAVWVVVVVAALLALLAVLGLVSEIPRFFDPCMHWGQGSGGSATLSPGGACRSVSGTSETRLGAALRLTLVDGLSLVAAGLAGWGALAARPKLIVTAGFLMVAETVVLFLGLSAAFMLTLGAACLFLALGFAWRSVAAPVPPPGTAIDQGWRPVESPPLPRAGSAAWRWIAVAAALAPVLAIGVAAVAGCSSTTVEAVPPGQPQATPHCSSHGSWQVLFFAVPPASAAAGILLRVRPLAWAGAAAFAAESIVFGLSMGFLIPFALVLLGTLTAWDMASRRVLVPPPALPPPPPPDVT